MKTTKMNRRSFLRGSAVVSIGAAFQALQPRTAASGTRVGPYGPLSPVKDETTGLPLIKLPKGFSYISTGWTGDPLGDGIPTPPGHDGMAVVAVDNHVNYMVRNHEIRDSGVAPGDPAIIYDPASLGGCSNLAFHTRRGRWLTDRAFLSISGTNTNCAGGLTPWGTWLTCEETLVSVGDRGSTDPSITYTRNHGYIFEVPGHPDQMIPPVPLIAMGRFVHEATAVDPATHYIYETQDRTPSGLYRFKPSAAYGANGPLAPGDLARGGTLEMLAIAGAPNADLIGETQGFINGTRWPVEWLPIEDPDRAHTELGDGGGTFDQGAAQGGAAFARLEGAWYSPVDSRIYFISTSGGAAGDGQLWAYDDTDQTLEMVFETPDPLTLNNPDNVTITPRGAVMFCEDGGAVVDFLGNIVRNESLMGLADGEIFSFAENDIILENSPNGVIQPGDYRTREWAGATFSADGEWLFVNIQTPGITFAITGPWHNGPF